LRIVIIAVGSRGDVQPYVALARGFQAAGDSVLLATHTEFATFVRNYGVEFAPLEGDPRAVLESDAGHGWQKAGANPVRSLYHMREVAKPIVSQLVRDCWEACQGADAILYSVLGFFPVYMVAKKLGIPAYPAFLQPSAPTRAFANYRMPPAPRRLGRARGQYNRLSHIFVDQLFWQMLRSLLQEARPQIPDAPPLPLLHPLVREEAQGKLHLYGYSRYVLPPPKDWGPWNKVCGYWFLDHLPTWEPPADLLAFLAAGPPPVFIGFGSMNNRDPEGVTNLVLEALAQTGQRGILATGWGGLHTADLPETVFPVGDTPYSWLFPKMAAVVHHGGAGTTAEGLRAGVPSVLIPFFTDQPLWARRVAALGVGPTPIPRKQLSADRLAAAIAQAVRDEPMRARAVKLGAKIRSEDGIAEAVSIIHQLIPHHARTLLAAGAR
jgi:UDP:flavonoid glycosyltransferase YjiC (YdhE family)